MGVYKLKSKIPFGRIADAKNSQISAANQNKDTVLLTHSAPQQLNKNLTILVVRSIVIVSTPAA
jgi:hypothetical protein